MKKTLFTLAVLLSSASAVDAAINMDTACGNTNGQIAWCKKVPSSGHPYSWYEGAGRNLDECISNAYTKYSTTAEQCPAY